MLRDQRRSDLVLITHKTFLELVVPDNFSPFHPTHSLARLFSSGRREGSSFPLFFWAQPVKPCIHFLVLSLLCSLADQFKNRRQQQRLSPSFCYPWLKMVFRRLKICFLICALASFVFVLLFGYLCPPSICYMRARVYEKYYLGDAVKNVYRSVHSYVSSVIDEYPEHVIRNDYRVNLHKEDVLVFLHIQKTGGTYLGKHLVRNLLIGQPCVCPPHVRRCHCDPAEDTMQLRSPSEFTCKCRKGKKKCTCLNGDGNIWLFSR